MQTFLIYNSFLLVACEAYRNTDDALNYVASGGNINYNYSINNYENNYHNLTIKVNVKRERRFDRPTVIFKFKMRSKICVYIQL